jgi:hypothetical protein
VGKDEGPPFALHGPIVRERCKWKVTRWLQER